MEVLDAGVCGLKVCCIKAKYNGQLVILKEMRESFRFGRDYMCIDSLKTCFDYEEQIKACKDVRIIGSKFTTNAKVFSEKPNFLLKIKKIIFQIIVIVNYSLRGKNLPSRNIPESCRKKIIDSGLYL